MKNWEGASITVASSILASTYSQLRECGQRRRECQLLWVASWQAPNRIVRTVHPRHAASAVSVDVDPAWLNAFFLELADREECVRAQVHTHPGSAFHSGVDDDMPVVRMPGLLSLVIPNFAHGEADLAGAYLAEQVTSGWREANISKRLLIGQDGE